MATEVLRPQDCLVRLPHAAFSRRRNYGGYMHNPKPSRRQISRSEKRAVVSKKPSCDDSRVAKRSGLVMEKVVILRRGESLDSTMKSDVVVCGTQRLGPDPEMVPKQIRLAKADVYAGSAFAVSPAPSALPLPSFSKKPSSAAVDDSATRDLRRLLRLE